MAIGHGSGTTITYLSNNDKEGEGSVGIITPHVMTHGNITTLNKVYNNNGQDQGSIIIDGPDE